MMTFEQGLDVMQLLAADAGCAVIFTPLHVVPLDGKGPPDYLEGYRGAFGRIPWPKRRSDAERAYDHAGRKRCGWPVEVTP